MSFIEYKFHDALVKQKKEHTPFAIIPGGLLDNSRTSSIRLFTGILSDNDITSRYHCFGTRIGGK